MHIKSLFWDSKAFSSACVGKSSCKWKFCCLESKSLTFHQHNFSLYKLKNWRQVCFLFYMYKWICKLKSFLNQELSLLTYIEAYVLPKAHWIVIVTKIKNQCDKIKGQKALKICIVNMTHEFTLCNKEYMGLPLLHNCQSWKEGRAISFLSFILTH